MNVFAGQLYLSTQSGSSVRVGTVGSGTPTTGGQTIANLPGFPTAGNPDAFFFADLDGTPGVDTLYVADDAAGILKFCSRRRELGRARRRGDRQPTRIAALTAIVSGGAVTVFATRKGGGGPTGGGDLVRLVDASGYDGTLVTSPTRIAEAPRQHRVSRCRAGTDRPARRPAERSGRRVLDAARHAAHGRRRGRSPRERHRLAAHHRHEHAAGARQRRASRPTGASPIRPTRLRRSGRVHVHRERRGAALPHGATAARDVRRGRDHRRRLGLGPGTRSGLADRGLRAHRFRPAREQPERHSRRPASLLRSLDREVPAPGRRRDPRNGDPARGRRRQAVLRSRQRAAPDRRDARRHQRHRAARRMRTATTRKAWSRSPTAPSGSPTSTGPSSPTSTRPASSSAASRRSTHRCPPSSRSAMPNRGMEGLTITPDGATLVAMMQSALQQPDHRL